LRQEKFAGCEGSFAQRELLIVLCQEVVGLVEDLYLKTLRTHDGLRIFQVLDLDVGLLVVHCEGRASVSHRQDILLNGKRQASEASKEAINIYLRNRLVQIVGHLFRYKYSQLAALVEWHRTPEGQVHARALVDGGGA
jgi:hypothetical protein